MPNISTLVDDINKMLESGEKEVAHATSFFSDNIVAAYTKQTSKREEKVRSGKVMYFSEMGDVCPRRIWYKFHTPTAGEKLAGYTKLKFLYGDVLEEVVLQLARDAGHTVEREQEVVEYAIPSTDWSIRGRIDAVIDGVVVDVKSVTKLSERKFENLLADDPFGYYGQINGYANVLKSEHAGFLTIQKELGHVKYWDYTVDKHAFVHCIQRYITSVDRDTPVEKTLDTVPQSATSKNMKLCTSCSYCQYKRQCFPTLRAFSYSGKVEFLTEVVTTPKVPEIDLEAGNEEAD